MDVGATSALTLSSYQTASSRYGQGVLASLANAINSSSSMSDSKNMAVFQDLSAIYSTLTGSASPSSSTTDSVLTTSTTSGLVPSTGGTSPSSLPNGNATLSAASLAVSAASFGGVDSTSASILFSGSKASTPAGLASAAINLSASVALASYSAYQSGIPTGTTLGAAATSASAKIDTTQPTDIQTAIQSAQSGLLNSTLSLLA